MISMKKVIGWLKSFGQEVGAEVIAEVLVSGRGVVRGEVKAQTNVARNRSKLYRFLLSPGNEDTLTWLRSLKNDNHAVRRLVELYQSCKKDKKESKGDQSDREDQYDEEELKRVFGRLNEMSDSERESDLSILTHDPIKQSMRNMGHSVDSLAGEALTHLEGFEGWLEERGVGEEDMTSPTEDEEPFVFAFDEEELSEEPPIPAFDEGEHHE